MKPFAFISGILFLICVYLQFNDPDPWLWTLVYGIAGLACFMFYYRYWPKWIYWVLAVVYLGGAVYQWPPEFEGVMFNELQKMRSMNIELARESLGMAIAAVILTILGFGVRSDD